MRTGFGSQHPHVAASSVNLEMVIFFFELHFPSLAFLAWSLSTGGGGDIKRNSTCIFQARGDV